MDTRETYVLLPDFDKAILATLPDEGAKMGFHVLAKQVRQIAADLGQGTTGASIAGRMVVLRHHEFVKPAIVQPVSKGKGWQITPAGKRYLTSNEEGS